MPNKKSNKLDDPTAAESIEPATAPKVNDVAKPGETPSPATARPIIIGHGSMLKKDPMMAADDKPEKLPDEASEEVLSKKSELSINPETNLETPTAEMPDAKQAETEPQPPEQEASEDEVEAAETEPQDTDVKEAEDTSTSDSAAIESVATAAEGKKPDAKQAEEEQKRKDKVQELISSRKYAVPIIEGGHKASSQRIMSWLFIVLLLAAIGIYLAIDAGYLDIGIALPFDLIKN